MKGLSVKKLTFTALLLALCVAVQQFKAISQFITGPIVNSILIIAVLGGGLYAGLSIAVLSPIFAALISPAPIMQALPQMFPVIIIGNASIVVCTYLFRNKNLTLGLIIGSIVKATLLWAGVSMLIIPMYGSGLNSVQVTMLTAMFSYNQLITALVGSIIALIIWRALKNFLLWHVK